MNNMFPQCSYGEKFFHIRHMVKTCLHTVDIMKISLHSVHAVRTCFHTVDMAK